MNNKVYKELIPNYNMVNRNVSMHWNMRTVSFLAGASFIKYCPLM